MKHLIFLIVSTTIMFIACSEPIEEPLNRIALPSDSVSISTKQQTILGKQIENPYSLDYMRKALEEVRKNSLSKVALNYVYDLVKNAGLTERQIFDCMKA